VTFLRVGVEVPSGPCEECLAVMRGLRTRWTDCDFKAVIALNAVRVTAVDIVDLQDDGMRRSQVVVKLV
jgi:hypothetical protein